MVGSELPVARAPRSRRSPTRSLLERRRTSRSRDAAGRAAARRHLASTIHRGEVLGIAGVEGNGQAELVEAIMGMRHAVAGRDRARRRRTSPAGRRASAARPASATSPRTGTGTGCCSTRRCGRTASSATRPRRPNVTRRRWIDRARRPRPTPSGSSSEYDVRTPGIDVTARGAVRRQPAEAHRRPRDERRPGAADRLAPDPRRRRRRPGRDLGPHPRRPARDGLAVLLISADLDELIGLSDTHQGDPARPARRPTFDPRDGHARGARLGDDRRRREAA